MRAWAVTEPGPIDSGPVAAVERAVPEPGQGEVRARVSVCGVCRTDLHLAEGDLPPKRPGVVPGHEVVGAVDALGPGATRFALGERIGIAWLRHTCGVCRFCRRGGTALVAIEAGMHEPHEVQTIKHLCSGAAGHEQEAGVLIYRYAMRTVLAT